MSNKQRTHHGKLDALSAYKFDKSGWKPPTVKKGQYVSRRAGMGRASDLSAEVRREETIAAWEAEEHAAKERAERAYQHAVALGNVFHAKAVGHETHTLCNKPLKGEHRTAERAKVTCAACMVALDEGLETGLLVLDDGAIRWTNE